MAEYPSSACRCGHNEGAHMDPRLAGILRQGRTCELRRECGCMNYKPETDDDDRT